MSSRVDRWEHHSLLLYPWLVLRVGCGLLLCSVYALQLEKRHDVRLM